MAHASHRFLFSLGLAGFLALGLGGCIKPLYGSADFGGLAVQKGLAGVKVEVIGERVAHYLRNELEFGLRGGDPIEAPITHRLVIVPKQRIGTAITDRISGTAESASLTLDAKYTLFALNKTVAATDGDATVVVSYDRSQQRFSSVRAARDAEILAAKQLAEQIKIRIAAFMASNR